MVERQRGDDDLPAVLDHVFDPARGLLHVGDHVAVGQHRALGDAGGAAGVLQKGEIFVRAGNRLVRLARAPAQRLLEGHALRQVERRHHFLDVLDHQVDDNRFREAQQIADLGRNHVPHRGFADHLLERATKVFHHDNGLGARVRQLMLQFAGRVQGVGVDDGKSGA